MAEKMTRPPSALDRLAAGGQPIRANAGSPVPVLRTRIPSLALPQAQLAQTQGAPSPTSSQITPALQGDIRKVANTEMVSAYLRRGAKGMPVSVGAYPRRGPDHAERPVYQASEESRRRAAADLEAWKAWKGAAPGSRERRQALTALLERLRGLIQQQVNRAMPTVNTTNIPRAAVEGEVMRLVMNGLKSYDPSRGAQLTTHLTTQFKGMQRFLGTYGYAARMPDELIGAIGPVRRAREHLADLLGRDPTNEEIAESTGIPVKNVVRLSQELRRALVRSYSERDPTTLSRSPIDEVLSLMSSELSDRERQLLELLREADRKYDEAAIRPAALAKKMGLSGPEFSNVKRSLTDKVMRHLGRQPIGSLSED